MDKCVHKGAAWSCGDPVLTLTLYDGLVAHLHSLVLYCIGGHAVECLYDAWTFDSHFMDVIGFH